MGPNIVDLQLVLQKWAYVTCAGPSPKCEAFVNKNIRKEMLIDFKIKIERKDELMII